MCVCDDLSCWRELACIALGYHYEGIWLVGCVWKGGARGVGVPHLPFCGQEGRVEGGLLMVVAGIRPGAQGLVCMSGFWMAVFSLWLLL